MKFSALVEQVLELLQRQGRVSYRALKREFDLDDDYIEDLKEEIIKARRLAIDEDAAVLVWAGGTTVVSSQSSVASSSQPPAPQTADSGLQTVDSKPQTLDPRRDAGERRQLTVMFCDVVGSTALSTQLDPEELRAVIQAYQRACVAVISRFDGHVAKYLGDGLLAYFGYPTAHEDDAARAVRAGLGIVAALQKQISSSRGALINQGSTEGQGEGAKISSVAMLPPYPNLPPQGGKEQSLQVRIGIHTGLVVAGEMGSGEYREHLAIVGETPNITARLQEHALPNSVVISATTARLVTGLFECQDLGLQTLKGIATPLTAYRVVRESEAQSRFEVAVRTGLTPLIGRAHEMGLLQERWERTKQGEGQVVLLSGEAGIGKSRLVQELKEQVSTEGATCLAFRCSPYHQHSAFYPILEHLQRLLQFEHEESPQAKLTKLQQTIAGYRFPQTDTLALLAALLSLSHPEGTPPIMLSPQKQKQKTQAALVAWLVEEAERTPVYCAWEDLHWADPSTVEVLHLLLAQVPTARMLTLLTFRPEFMPPWRPRSHITQLTLSRLGRHHVGEMVEEVAGGKALPQEILQQIVAKTDGVPLFVEELTKMVMESDLYVGAQLRPGSSSGHAPLPSLGIPATLHDALMARLDRLGPTKEIAQVGATLGREFSYEVIHAISPLDEATLQQGLLQLVEAELLYQRGVSPQARYLFKHALVQDAAYQSLLKSTRQQYHHQIAQVLEGQFPEIKETQPELLAHHYTEAGLIEQAIPYWHEAGEKAIERSANSETISHLTKGLELLKTLPDTPARVQQEILLQVNLGLALMAIKGFAAPEARNAYARARELCQQAGETPQLFSVLRGLWEFYHVGAELQTARALAEQLLTLAHSVHDSSLLLEAHSTLGMTLMPLGEWAASLKHCEQLLALYNPQRHHAHAFLYGGYDPGVNCLGWVAWCLWGLGYPNQALKRLSEAFALAQELSHPHSTAYAQCYAAQVHQFRREEVLSQERAETAQAFAIEYGFPLESVTILRGWALVEQGQGEEGLVQMRQSLDSCQAMGTKLLRPYFLALVAEAYGKVDQTAEGLTVLAEALALVDKTGERWCEAELYRIKGELTLQKEARGWRLETSSSFPQASSPKPQVSQVVLREAETCFLKAIEVAQHQQAKSLELRAVMSLSRLWQQQGKKEEAQQMLAEIYSWFTEGFDTKDLQEAKVLLDELR